MIQQINRLEMLAKMNNILAHIQLFLGVYVSPYSKTILSMTLLFLVHYFSTFLYYSKCIYTPWNFIFPVTPICSYSLDVINLSRKVIDQMYYAIGGYVILKLKTLVSGILFPRIEATN